MIRATTPSLHILKLPIVARLCLAGVFSFGLSSNYSDNEGPKCNRQNIGLLAQIVTTIGSRPLCFCPAFSYFPLKFRSLMAEPSSGETTNSITFIYARQNPCNLIRRKGRGANSSKFMEGKGFGQLGSIRQLTAQEMSEAAVRPVNNIHSFPCSTYIFIAFPNQQTRGRNNDRSLNTNTDSKSRLRTGSLRSSNLTTAINSIPNYGAVIDKVDVFNSVEIRVAAASSSADDALRGYTSRSTSGTTGNFAAFYKFID